MNLNGVKVPHHKNTMNCETVSMPVPASVTIPLLQHMGTPCTPAVKVKDEVKVGRLLAGFRRIHECADSFQRVRNGYGH